MLARQARYPVVAYVLSLALSAALVASPAAAELAAWDQAQVTAIAQDLAKACDGWQQAMERQPGDTLGSGAAGEAFDLVEQSRALREQSRSLADRLAKGEGRDATKDAYGDLEELIHDTEQAARRAELDESTMDTWAKVADAQRRLAPYYDAKAM